VASSKPGPFQEFYTALLTKGIKPEMARLTLARKIATIVLIVWKRGEVRTKVKCHPMRIHQRRAPADECRSRADHRQMDLRFGTLPGGRY
jgi:hypothetical protein